ncbi:hypothetical protein IFM89_018811 [Coptis chinensis]|uniref:Uncharacterized protein n=1 Tax=Coptis chinensis TaxID=261450 RepID=A0A835GYW0_9MAGN|nr:hypothetical protein IFM89_018811 [Coptis chinensis]
MREEKMKREKEVVDNRYAKLRNKSEEKKKELIAVNGRLQEKKIDHKVVSDRERRLQERVATLSNELKKMSKYEREVFIELKTEANLECAKRRAENEIEVWMNRFKELETSSGLNY